MVDFPYMLYKHPGPNEIHGSKFDTLIVEEEADLSVALTEGWQLSTYAALKAVDAPIPKTICNPDIAPEVPAPIAPPKSVGKPVKWKT